jgi:phosphate transport system substrate-binding protein
MYPLHFKFFNYLILTVLGILLSACASEAASTSLSPTPVVAEESPHKANTILVDGSSTVGPITLKVAEAFGHEHPEIEIPVGISGTGGGFKMFCAGETDISDASRPIKEEEVELCQKNGIEYIELPVAFDGLAVTVNPANDFVNCLTTAELKKIWEPAAEGEVLQWRQVHSDFPNEELWLYGAGTESGTYDYFTEAIIGSEGESRNDFLGSEDDHILVKGIAKDRGALGFFGLSYYEENRAQLKLVAVDNGQGCVEPNTETVAKGLYQPLSRPLFIYVNQARTEEKKFIDTFVDFYLANAAQLVDDVGYIPLTDSLYELAQKRYEQRFSGSVFEGIGSYCY